MWISVINLSCPAIMCANFVVIRCIEMAALHYHHSLVAKVFFSWKQWCCDCKEIRLKELTRRLQQEKMAALLARVSAVHHDNPSPVGRQQCLDKVNKENKLCQHDPHTEGKECQPLFQDESLAVGKDYKLVCEHDPHIVGKSRHPHNSSKTKLLKLSKESAPSLITSKLVRQELVSQVQLVLPFVLFK